MGRAWEGLVWVVGTGYEHGSSGFWKPNPCKHASGSVARPALRVVRRCTKPWTPWTPGHTLQVERYSARLARIMPTYATRLSSSTRLGSFRTNCHVASSLKGLRLHGGVMHA